MRTLPAPRALALCCTLALGLSACGDKDDDTGSTGSGGGSDDGGDDGVIGEDEDDDDGGSGSGDGGEEEDEPVHGTVTGRVYVELYDYTTGDSVSWDDYGGTFPYGPIFIAAYKDGTDDEGAPTLDYKGQTAIALPTPNSEGDAFEVPVTLGVEGNVKLYAALDYDGDTVIGTDEPRGVYPATVKITDGGTAEGVEITIVAPVNVPGGGGCGSGVIDLRGEAILTSDWVDGDIAVMLLDTERQGPYHSTRVTPTSEGAGASSDYDLATCAGYGDMNLVGAWDSNGNGVFDPMDLWGSYVVDEVTDGNPVDVGLGVLDGLEVRIPFGSSEGLGVYPFITASGALTWSGGSFDGLPAGATVHAVALKYRPSGDVNLDELEAYDSQEWTSAEYAGKSSLDWELMLPVNSVAFLWFYVDADADGLVNEHGEPVGSAGSTDGRFPTGTSSTSGLSVELATAD